jgi:hypothetical protein
MIPASKQSSAQSICLRQYSGGARLLFLCRILLNLCPVKASECHHRLPAVITIDTALFA